ncbi:MAG: glycosyltransferase [Candidatus Eremiobacteraeota bacterium]|nr:glycosyltransferase [Candidatus Eremiobacteraeota bacterium]
MENQGRKLKVLHIITRFICGGADENTLFTVNGLDKARYEVHLMIGSIFEDLMVNRLDEDVKLLTIREMGREVAPFKDLQALFKIYSLIAKEKYDIVHTHTSKAGFIGRLAAKMAGTPCIVHGVHTIPFTDVLQPRYNGFFLLLERWAARYTRIFISVGNDLKERYLSHGIGRPECYRTVYSGMDLELFERAAKMDREEIAALRREFGIRNGEQCVGIVSRLEPGKGFNFFAELVEAVVSRTGKVKFVVVGDGSLKARLLAEVKARRMEEYVHFAGFRDDVAKVIASFDIAIFTSLLEGLPRTVVQYAMMEKPIVTFEVGGIREVVRDGENGYIIEEHNLPLFVEKLSSLIGSPQVRDAMRLREKEFPRHLWSKERMVAEIDSIYQGLVAGNYVSLPESLVRTS